MPLLQNTLTFISKYCEEMTIYNTFKGIPVNMHFLFYMKKKISMHLIHKYI